jgi:hypothetical protein
VADGAVVAAVLALRFFVPLTILRYPLPGILASMLADSIDGAIFDSYTSLSLENYQFYDKSLDIYYLAIAYIATLRNWVDPRALRIAQFLWYYRLLGVALFATVDSRMLLFIFPATFEYFFIFYEAVRLRWDPGRLGTRTLLAVAAGAWVFLKLPQEYWLHIAQGSTTEWLKVSVFGMDASTPRLEVLAANLWILPVVGGIVAVVVGISAFALRFAPPGDHQLSFDANRQGPAQVRLVGRPRFSWPVFSLSLAEKVILVALISIIFAEFLPGVDASALQMTLVLGAVVVLNAAIGSWQARRGMEWREATVEFGTIVVVNGAIILTIAEPGQRLHRPRRKSPGRTARRLGFGGRRLNHRPLRSASTRARHPTRSPRVIAEPVGCAPSIDGR